MENQKLYEAENLPLLRRIRQLGKPLNPQAKDVYADLFQEQVYVSGADGVLESADEMVLNAARTIYCGEPDSMV